MQNTIVGFLVNPLNKFAAKHKKQIWMEESGCRCCWSSCSCCCRNCICPCRWRWHDWCHRCSVVAVAVVVAVVVILVIALVAVIVAVSVTVDVITVKAVIAVIVLTLKTWGQAKRYSVQQLIKILNKESLARFPNRGSLKINETNTLVDKTISSGKEGHRKGRSIPVRVEFDWNGSLHEP